MDGKKVGQVTQEEKDEIRRLFERKNGLTELFRSLGSAEGTEIERNGLYEKLVVDMGVTSSRFQDWWNEKSKKYGWESQKGHRWQIDFSTNEVFLVKE